MKFFRMMDKQYRSVIGRWHRYEHAFDEGNYEEALKIYGDRKLRQFWKDFENAGNKRPDEPVRYE